PDADPGGRGARGGAALRRERRADASGLEAPGRDALDVQEARGAALRGDVHRRGGELIPASARLPRRSFDPATSSKTGARPWGRALPPPWRRSEALGTPLREPRFGNPAGKERSSTEGVPAGFGARQMNPASIIQSSSSGGRGPRVRRGGAGEGDSVRD